MTEIIDKRERFIDEDGNVFEVNNFWYSPKGYIIKWSIVTGLFLTFFLYVVIGHMHAKSRLRKGLKPLKYHAWLLPKYQRNPYTASPASYYPQSSRPPMQQGGGMQGYYGNNSGNNYNNASYPEPPPLYYSGEQPPIYQGPNAGAEKQGQNGVNVRQSEIAPPPGPPPGQIERGEAGMELPQRARTKVSSPFRWLNRRE